MPSKSSDHSICIVSGADEIKLRSYINHVIYAREYNFDYRLESGIAKDITNKFFYKTRTVERLLPSVEWLIWLDDDVYFTNFEVDSFRPLIAEAEELDKFLVIAEGAKEPRGFSSVINTGVFLIRNDERSFNLLRRMHEGSLDEVRAWWDETAHGVFTHGDQDLMLWVLKTSGMEEDVTIVAPELLNSRTHLYTDSVTDARICHFCGHFDKVLSVAKFGERFQLGQELVPADLLDAYRVRVRSPVKSWELKIRSLRQLSAAKLKPYLGAAVRRRRARKEQRMGF